MMNRNGVHCQTSATISVSRASGIDASQSTLSEVICNRIKMSEITRPSLNASFQMNATADGMNSIGIGLLVSIGFKALMKVPAANKALTFLKTVGKIIAAPFVGLAFILLFPFIGMAMLVWTGMQALAMKVRAG